MKDGGSLEEIFNPKSVAFIGVSRQESKLGYVKSMIASDFKGKMFLINPKANRILNLEVFPNIREIKENIDLAVVTVPAHSVRESVIDCVEAGVKGIIIITAGFAELGEEDGQKLQQNIVSIAREGGVRIVGPNCLGIYSSSSGLNTTGFSPISPGGIALVSQSGNMMLMMVSLAKRYGIGFSKLVSLGNQSDITFDEFVKYLGSDTDTKVIIMYAEGFNNGKALLNVAFEVTQRKPIVLLKAGRTEAGIRAAFSHTGALAGNDVISNAVFKQMGIIRVDNYYELLSVAETFSKLPLLKGKKVAILGGGGGHATIMSDCVVQHGLEIPVLSENTQRKLKGILPRFASTKNPIDIAGGGENYPSEFWECSKICLEDDEIMGVIIFGGFGAHRQEEEKSEEKHAKVAMDISSLVREYGKPIIMQTRTAENIEGIGLKKPLEILRSNGIPVYPSVEISARSMAALLEYSRVLEEREDKSEEIRHSSKRAVLDKKFGSFVQNGFSNLLVKDIEEIFKVYGIPLIRTEVARNSEMAVEIAESIGYPIVMKVYSPDVVHKSDIGGVRLNIGDRSELIRCYQEVMLSSSSHYKGASIIGITLSPMEKCDVEIIIGMIRDQQFGPVIMFGLGGIFVEVIKDVAFRAAPLSYREAEKMIREIKAYPILVGERGREEKDVGSLVDMIVKVSQMVIENPEIEALDLNPVFVYKRGSLVIDARMRLNINREIVL